MKSASEWSTEAMYCHQIHDTDAQRAMSLKLLIRRVQLDAWQQGASDAITDIVEVAKARLLPIPKQLQEPIRRETIG